MAISPETKSIDIGTLAQWAGATATFLAVLVALFKDEFLRWRRKPKLRLSVSLAPPDCHKTTVTYVVQKVAPTYNPADCYYLRLWVENVGKTRAERVQVFVAKLSRRTADGSFKNVDQFLPMNLRWSHAGSKTPEIFAEGISPEMGRHCDLAHLVDPTFRKDVGTISRPCPPQTQCSLWNWRSSPTPEATWLRRAYTTSRSALQLQTVHQARTS
jgi:hypothetical protein